MRFEINNERVRRLRLRLAHLIAPPGADVHDPDDTCCPSDRPLLGAVLWWRLRFTDGQHWMDVDLSVHDALAAELIEYNPDGYLRLTGYGENELARMWGDDRVPPWSGGYFQCHDHGVYDLAPGERIGCPDCGRELAAQQAAQQAPRWWPLRARGGAPR